MIAGLAAISQRDIARYLFQPGLIEHLLAAEGRAAGTDQRVTAAQMRAKPPGIQTALHRVAPEPYFGQLDCGAVEVNTVNVVEADIRLDFLQFARALIWLDADTEFGLTPAQILVSQLAH